jgi:carboxyl-terminal processing protease
MTLLLVKGGGAMLRPALLALTWALSSVTPGRHAPAGLADRVWAITDAVVDHHLDPPARQQMILDGLGAVCRAAKVERPPSLVRRVSTLASPEALAALLDEVWSLAPSDEVSIETGRVAQKASLEDILLEGLLGKVAGLPRLLSAKELMAEQQLAENNYVGLHFAAAYNQESRRPQVGEVFPGGPGDRAGLKARDLIEEIDGVSTEGMALREAVERLRGALGTTVELRLRQPGSEETRAITATRGLLPRPTLQGIRKFSDGTGEVMVRGPGRIAYLKFQEITGSTRQELRVLARQIDAEGAAAVVLDFRPVERNPDIHPTVLLADLLLEEGTIGRVRSATRVETFRAEPDAFFQGLPLAVLVDDSAPGPVLWLAMALQDNQRAAIVSGPAPGPGSARSGGPPRFALERGGAGGGFSNDTTLVHSAVAISGGTWSVLMPTGRLERGDGRPVVVARTRVRRPMPPGIVAPDQGNEGEDAAGGRLIPDLRIEAPSANQTRPDPALEPAELDPNVRGDAALTAALGYLRTVLKQPEATAP